MDVFEFALKMEKDGESFYREMATVAGESGVAKVLNMLAKAEVKHYEAIKAMQQNEYAYTAQPVMAPAINIFQEMKMSGEKVFDLKGKQLDAYSKAQELEKKSMDFYRLQAKEMKASPAGEIFAILADEEEKHFKLLDSITDFVSRPEMWLENAEFTKLEEY